VGVQHDRHVDDLEAEAGRGAGRRFEVEDRHRPLLEAVQDRVVEGDDRNPDRGVVGAGVDRFFIERAELRARALGDGERIAEQPRREPGDDFLLQGGDHRERARRQLAVVSERLVEVEPGGQLERVRACLRVDRPVFVFGDEFEVFQPEPGLSAADLDLARQRGRRRFAAADRHFVFRFGGRGRLDLDEDADFDVFERRQVVFEAAGDRCRRHRAALFERQAVPAGHAFAGEARGLDRFNAGGQLVGDHDGRAHLAVQFLAVDLGVAEVGRARDDHPFAFDPLPAFGGEFFAFQRQVRRRGTGFELPAGRRHRRAGSERSRRCAERAQQCAGRQGEHERQPGRDERCAHRRSLVAVFFAFAASFLRAARSQAWRLLLFLYLCRQAFSALASFCARVSGFAAGLLVLLGSAAPLGTMLPATETPALAGAE
jgi:hypothetical protein